MGLDKKFLSESYGRMSDQELLSIVSNDIKDLTEEAQEVLKEELAARGLGKGIDKTIEMQTKKLDGKLLDEYVEMIREMPCPDCSSTVEKLNCILVVKGRYLDYVIACPGCLKTKGDEAVAESLGLGLLGGIGGAIKSANTIAAYQNNMAQVKKDEPSNALISFIEKRIGEIELFRNNKEKLADMIRNPNAKIY